jgi:hypothetical protein
MSISRTIRVKREARPLGYRSLPVFARWSLTGVATKTCAGRDNKVGPDLPCWYKANITIVLNHVAFGGKADMAESP